MKKFTISFILVISILSIIMSTEIDHTDQIRKVLNSFMDSSPKELFKIWHMLYRRDYALNSEEANLRYIYFKINLSLVKETNAKNLDYKFGLNEFSDMSQDEFEQKYCTRKPNWNLDKEISKLNKELGFLPANEDDDLTKRNLQMSNIDYTSLYLPPRSQGSCGSCWTFSSTGAIEGNIAKKKGTPVNYLATQQLMDCAIGTSGCDGAGIQTTFTYITIAGLMNDSDYPYVAKKEKCKLDVTKIFTKIKGYEYCSNYSDNKKCTTQIFYNLLARGPLSIGIDGTAMRSYINGIFSGRCSKYNHAVVAVGYGTLGSQSYWIVRNSWGPSWGEKGYLRVLLDSANENSCFIENEAILPLIA